MTRVRSLVVSLSVGLAVASAGACSSEDPPAGPGTQLTDPPEPSDAAAPGRDGGAAADGSTADAPAGPGTTALEADINGVKRPLDRAQFGDERPDGGAQLLYVEAHSGGDPACPDADGGAGASPARTVIVANVPRAAAGTSFTKADGVAVTLLDFDGSQIPGNPPFVKATALTVTVVAIDPAPTPSFVDLDLDATFAEGTVKGRIHAEYCASMSR